MENLGNEDVKIYLSFVDLWMNYIIRTWLGVLRTGPPSQLFVAATIQKKAAPTLHGLAAHHSHFHTYILLPILRRQGCLASRMLGW
jgi:hypothetical protein